MFVVSCRTHVNRLYACAQIHWYILVIIEFGLDILRNPVTLLTLFVLKILQYVHSYRYRNIF